jgi:methionine biosynthesis protein MetW
MKKESVRTDFEVINSWIKPQSSVLDLGCGDGSLLQKLFQTGNAKGMGVEKDLSKITATISRGIPVIEADIDDGLSNFSDGSYDFVILSQTIQEVRKPDQLISEMLRVGQWAIISFPNFGNIGIRIRLLFKGRMPRSEILPYEWYNTPNIHLLTMKDFEWFCLKAGIRIERKAFFYKGKELKTRLLPNFFAETCLMMLRRYELGKDI